MRGNGVHGHVQNKKKARKQRHVRVLRKKKGQRETMTAALKAPTTGPHTRTSTKSTYALPIAELYG